MLPVITHELVLVHQTGVITVWTAGSGITEDVELDITPTLKSMFGYLYLVSENRCTELNSWLSSGRLKSANHMK
eukprot:5502141-Amphidinium_carterae.1